MASKEMFLQDLEYSAAPAGAGSAQIIPVVLIAIIIAVINGDRDA